MSDGDFRKITKFTDLIVWQEGHKLVLMVYRTTGKVPNIERFGIVDQMRRAVVSFTSNIAEGFAKRSSKEKNKFYNIAQTSLIELQNQLLVCRDVGYVDKKIFDEIANQTVVCHRLINALMRATRQGKFKS